MLTFHDFQVDDTVKVQAREIDGFSELGTQTDHVRQANGLQHGTPIDPVRQFGQTGTDRVRAVLVVAPYVAKMMERIQDAEHGRLGDVDTLHQLGETHRSGVRQLRQNAKRVEHHWHQVLAVTAGFPRSFRLRGRRSCHKTIVTGVERVCLY
jgi:hypothetical protein